MAITFSFFGYTPKCTPRRVKCPVSHVRFCEVLPLPFINIMVLHLAGRERWVSNRKELGRRSAWGGCQSFRLPPPPKIRCPYCNLTVLPCPNLAVRPYGNLSVLLKKVDTFSSGGQNFALWFAPPTRVYLSQNSAPASRPRTAPKTSPFFRTKETPLFGLWRPGGANKMTWCVHSWLGQVL